MDVVVDISMEGKRFPNFVCIKQRCFERDKNVKTKRIEYTTDTKNKNRRKKNRTPN